MVTSTKSTRSHTPRKPVAASQVSRKPSKPNASILSFFKKEEKKEESLFVGVAPEVASNDDDDLYSADDVVRYNEMEGSNKKRRLGPGPDNTTTHDDKTGIAITTTSTVHKSPATPDTENGVRPKAASKPKIKTPFVVDSDSEDDAPGCAAPTRTSTPVSKNCADLTQVASCEENAKERKEDEETSPLLHQLQNALDEDFEPLDDYSTFTNGLDDPETFEGEEMREMRFMREQARLEAEEAGDSSEAFADEEPLDDESMIECCPVCNGSLAGITADAATRHVNSCLDGDPIPLPQIETAGEKPSVSRSDQIDSTDMGKRFARAAIPRPGQANPFDLNGTSNTTTKSAFSALMSNNAEDSAWATAAATEHASRGKPAYQRTCPFYKIMPGFSICVDAFRYGAVEGCKAYFLSHFHSDHYIGLTASWRHGPIYCSKVTGSLVKQQLRTAAKWVVELEFEKSYDIPGTDGATVTMIPANHCPGSSLFLFEKTIKRGSSGRVQRILHCGDFRACPAHISHPLLKPEVVDSISGKAKQQKIDICYLDTTYLNPRYSFPPQEDVIKACADLCSSMSPDAHCKDDVWEKSAGTPAVSKYFQGKKEEDGSKPTNSCPRQRLLVICGTYSIGKERICIAIAKALGSKIFASASKIKICQRLGDPELTALLTSDPLEAQVHMQMLMEIRAETLQEYLNGYKPHFSRIVGLRPSGWNYRPNGKAITANTSPGSIPTEMVLHDKGWRSRFRYKDFVPQRGSTKEAMCFGVPYSEHSSFRELAMFVMSLRIDKVIPTVNVGSEQSRKRMKAWIDRWTAERRRGGLLMPLIEGQDEGDSTKALLWDGKSGKGGGAWW